MKKLLFSILLVVVVLFAFVTMAPAQVQNMQAGSGTTGDLTKPSGGFNLASGQVFNVKTGATVSGAGTFDFTLSAFKVPNSSAPTTSAFGSLAGDNNAWASGRGALQFFDGTANTYIIGALASSTPSNGYILQWNTGGTITWAAPAAGSIGGSSGATDKALIRANGTGGATVQGSTATLGDDAILTLPQASLAANTSGDGAILSNSTAATVGNQRYSPRLRLTGNGWKTTATAGSQVTDWIMENRPVQGAANPTSQLAIASQINAGGYTDRFVFDSGGSIYFGPSASAPAITASSGALSITAAATNNNINVDPAGTGILSISKDTVSTDSTSSRAWVGPTAGASSFNIQRSGNTYSYLLSAGASPNAAFQIAEAAGSLTALTATPSGRPFTFGAFTYGGSTWFNAAYMQMQTTQLQSESARGAKIIFVTTPNSTAVAAIALILDQDQSVKSPSPLGGLGYATGAGGVITQATSRTTGVIINNVCGAITLVSAAGSATPQSFTVTNSAVTALDTIIVSQKSGTDLYEIFVTNVGAGSFKITYFTTGGTTTEQPVFNFAVIRAVAS